MLRIYDKLKDIDFKKYKALYCQQIEQLRIREYSHRSYAEGTLSAEDDFWFDTETYLGTDNAIICIWEEDGLYISGLRAEPYKEGYLLTNLETDANYRNRGYATSVIMGLEKYLSDIGVGTLYAHISVRNRVSLMLHKKLGFYLTQDFATLIDGTTSHNYHTYCLQIKMTGN